MSTARSMHLYVEPKTIKRLRLALKLYPHGIMTSGAGREVTSDELGDQLLNEIILRKFPLVKDLEKVLTEAERDFIADAKGKT